MFIDLKGFDGAPISINVRHIMAVSQSPAQRDLDPPIVTLMMQCGSSSEEWNVQGDLSDVLKQIKESGWELA